MVTMNHRIEKQLYVRMYMTLVCWAAVGVCFVLLLGWATDHMDNLVADWLAVRAGPHQGEGEQAHHPRGRCTLPAQHAQRMSVPDPLPLRDRTVRTGGAEPHGQRERTHGCLLEQMTRREGFQLTIEKGYYFFKKKGGTNK